MSLYLVELKIKTALELAILVEQRLRGIPSVQAECARRDVIRQQGVLREIINRPKEEGSNG